MKTYLTIPQGSTLRSAMQCMTISGEGIICVVTLDGKVVGILTDGDIRTFLLKYENLEATVDVCMNSNFVFAHTDSSKENVLKLLNHKIKKIPILDNENKLIKFVGSGYLYEFDRSMARSRSPARLSFAGGGTDVTEYFMKHGGVSLSTAFAKYAYAFIKKRDDKKIKIKSDKWPADFEVSSIHELHYGDTHNLAIAVIKLFKPEFGFELNYYAEFPPSSGLGGSAAILSAIIGVFNEISNKQLDRYSIAEYSYEIERIELGIGGGWQDQYATVFGGTNYIEYKSNENLITPIKIDKNIIHELEASLVLCHTGEQHLGQKIQERAMRQTSNSNPDHGESLKLIANEMKLRLLRGNLDGFGGLLSKTWELKRGNISEVSNMSIDKIYDYAIKCGADGGRLLGTGGGGYFLFYVRPGNRVTFWQKMIDSGCKLESVIFDNRGLTSWTCKF